MSPHQSFPLWHNVPGKAQDWSAIRINCYAVHNQAKYSRYTRAFESRTVQAPQYMPTGGTARYYSTASSLHSVRSHWSPEQLHGSPPTYRLGLPPDKNVGCSSLLNLPTGRDDPPDKEITYNCMNGSPGDPPSTVVQQSRQEEDRLPHNPTGDSTTLLCTGGFQSIFNHFLSTQNLSGKGTGSGTDARTCKQITVPK
jgi:hypothetical protein